MRSDFQARRPARPVSTEAADGPRAASLELAEYLRSPFRVDDAPAGLRVPLDDEAFVATWRGWSAEAAADGVFATLSRHLPQLRFPIAEGISRSADYREAVGAGRDAGTLPGATGLELTRPEGLRLEVHATPAGALPVIIAADREDFVALVRALGKRNEPAPVPTALGALMIGGYLNWRRVEQARLRFEAQPEADKSPSTWLEAFAELMHDDRGQFQDLLVLLSEGPYSAVPAAALGLGEAEWRERSLIARREHEFAHYATRRFFGSMRSHLHDELIADHAGLVAAFGSFRAEVFLRLIGLDSLHPRRDARAANYRGELTDAAFTELCALLRRAAFQVEAFDRGFFGDGAPGAPREERKVEQRLAALAALAAQPLDQLARPGADERMAAQAGRWLHGLRHGA
jgi:hypothetical protein